MRRGGRGVLRLAVSVTAAVALLGLLGWFTAELAGGGTLVGLSERLLAASQAIWPLTVVLSLGR